MELPNDASAIVFRYLQIKYGMSLEEILKTVAIIINNYIDFIYTMLGFIGGRLALVMYL